MRFKIVLLTVSFIIICAGSLFGQDTLIISNDESTERISMNLDSLVNLLYVNRNLEEIVQASENDTIIPIYPDSVYRNRLSLINSTITLPYNSIIRNHIHVYTVKKREIFSIIMGLKDYYFPMIEDIFDSYGLPAELKYMAVIESALNPNAVSRMGATGLWQFMYSTGRSYGLTINSVVDDRRDPVKSTYAAARYIKDLYGIYKDWILVIAAYNCGPGNVNKAIRRSGNRKDYWEIFYRLPRETRGYIPQYIAAVYAINYYNEHNITPISITFPIATDTIMINKDIHLSQIAEVMGISLKELRVLNPQYRTGLVPGSSRPLSLTLPVNHLGDFIDMRDTIRNYKSNVYLNKSGRITNPVHSAYIPPSIKGKTKLVYVVKEGDNLGYIAEWYRVGLSKLRYWNNIYRNTIRIGQKLVVYVDNSESGYFSKINSMSFAEKQRMVGKDIPSSSKSDGINNADNDGEYVIYTVRYGDTIWDIARMFDNVTTTQVLSLNNISDPGKIRVGQKLKIKKKS